MKKIKLENILLPGYDTKTGIQKISLTSEFVCENCRHLVKDTDDFCWQCGQPLQPSTDVEHWAMGKKLKNPDYEIAKTKNPEEVKQYIKDLIA